MALANYTDLQNRLTDWLGHSIYSANYPDFVYLFEAKANRQLRVGFQQKTNASFTTVSGVANLPADYIASVRITWNGTPSEELRYVTPDYLRNAFPDSATPSGSDRPHMWTYEGTTIIIRPVDDVTTYTQLYFATVPPLVTNSTNWLMTNYPDAYLYGTLAEAAEFSRDDNMTAYWGQKREAVFEAIRIVDDVKAPVATYVLGPTP